MSNGKSCILTLQGFAKEVDVNESSFLAKQMTKPLQCGVWKVILASIDEGKVGFNQTSPTTTKTGKQNLTSLSPWVMYEISVLERGLSQGMSESLYTEEFETIKIDRMQ